MGDELYESGGEETPARRWRGAFTWIGLITAAGILYEVTYQPAPGVAALCLKFGWEDFKTARWLWRFDPWKARGLACWWTYISLGLVKAVGVAGGMNLMIAVVAVTKVLLAKQGLDTDWIVQAAIGGVLTMFAGFGLCLLTALWTLGLARRHGLRLWLHGSVSDYRRNRIWPPGEPARPSRNQLGFLLVMPCALLSLIPAFVFVIRTPLWLVVVLTVAVVLTGRRLVYTAKAAIANSAAECWPPDEVAAAADDPVQ
jgi:hypothetical protein